MDFTVVSVRTAAISYMYFATPLVIRATSHLHQYSLATQVVRTIGPTALKHSSSADMSHYPSNRM
jgi:hypothetical protein